MTTLAPFDRFCNTSEQRDRALKLAAKVRFGRTDLKRDVWAHHRAGASILADALRSSSPLIASMEAWAVVRLVRGMPGPTAVRLLRSSRVELWTRVERFSPLQREALAGHLRAYAERVTSRRTCAKCGEQMRSASELGLCGFCIGELEEESR